MGFLPHPPKSPLQPGSPRPGQHLVGGPSEHTGRVVGLTPLLQLVCLLLLLLCQVEGLGDQPSFRDITLGESKAKRVASQGCQA
jgi:hypothetical protein